MTISVSNCIRINAWLLIIEYVLGINKCCQLYSDMKTALWTVASYHIWRIVNG